MIGNGFLPQTLFLTLKQEDSCVFTCVWEREREGDRERERGRSGVAGGSEKEDELLGGERPLGHPCMSLPGRNLLCLLP